VILVVGGLGFVGANTARAFLDLGEECIVTGRHTSKVPDFLREEVGRRLFVETFDVHDTAELRSVGERHAVTGIVHLLTGGLPVPPGSDARALVEDAQSTIALIADVVQAAHEWGVRRVTLAGAPVIYMGVDETPWREDGPLAMTASFSMELAKKCTELVSRYLGSQLGVECIQVRLASMYGPNYDPRRSSLVARLVHAGLRGEQPDLTSGHFLSAYGSDAGDQCYVKDAARGIALLQTATHLNHRVYNIASGRSTTNQQVADAVAVAIPGFHVDLPEREDTGAASVWSFDVTRASEDIGYRPAFDIVSGVADYAQWLRAGHER
jgi:UDP-glucose 4-epimerase